MILKHFTLFALLGMLAACTPGGPVLADRPDALGQPVARSEIGSLLNSERSAKGLSRLSSSGRLTNAAQGHADDMAAKGYFSHQSADGRQLGDRVRALGYRYCAVAENIAQGQDDVAEVVQAWMASSGHRRNILDPELTEFGVGRAAGRYWVLVLARPGC